MASGTQAGRFGRLLALLVAAAVVLGGISFAVPDFASAQEQARRPWSLRDLFRPRKADRVEPKAVQRAKPRRKPRPAEPTVPVVEKLPDARTVLVVGDFLGGGLAEGLVTVFEQNPRVRVIDRTSGSSGFVREDFYNWPVKVGELIDAEKPAAVIVMLGANDRQQMRVGDAREAPRSPAWDKEYARRAESLARAIADKRVPFLWVGVPSFKSPKMVSDMLAFNDIYRAAAEGMSAEFVDIWDGFVDENGAYVSSGPDLNGQPVRLRANDGINLTRPGKRKVAFYVEKPLFKILGESGASGVASFAPASLPAQTAPVIDPGSIERTVPVSLRDPALDGGTELMGLIVAPKKDAKSPGEKLSVEGIAPAAAPGRADDFTWPPPVVPAAPESTSAIRN